jgi:hypothetical protein
MGVVHLAQRPGERPVALKVLRPHIVGDDEARRRLAREVGSLSRIRSHRIAEIVDADPWGDIPYVATRYVPGLTLHDHVQHEGALSGPDLLWFADCLAEALESVHRVGVLHRDIKPSNVIMEGRTPILIDFGLARVADDPRLTMTGWLLGTPGFLAPEILHGEDATTASDVHAWAATVAFAGLGRAPFGRGPTMAVMDRVRRGDHDLAGLDPRIRPLVEHALAPDPTQRPGLAEIRDWLEHLGPTSARRAAAPQSDPAPLTVPLVAGDHAVRPAPTFNADAEFPDTEFISDDYLADPRLPLGQRLRAVGLILATGLIVAASVSAAPYVALAVVCVVIWLLRSASLAASAVQRRRDMRGRRWWDPVVALLAAPWHLVAGLGGAVVLSLWSLGISLAAALLCFAVSAPLLTSLAIVGATFALAAWVGPGSERLRGPVLRSAEALAVHAVPWSLIVLLLVASAAGLAALSMSGPAWVPASEAPFSGIRTPAWL